MIFHLTKFIQKSNRINIILVNIKKYLRKNLIILISLCKYQSNNLSLYIVRNFQINPKLTYIIQI